MNDKSGEEVFHDFFGERNAKQVENQSLKKHLMGNINVVVAQKSQSIKMKKSPFID